VLLLVRARKCTARISTCAAEETRASSSERAGIATVCRCDMDRVRDEVKAAVDACVARYGRIDILVNNVGGSAPGDPVAMPEDVWDAQLDHNLKTAFLRLQACAALMEKQGSGAIIGISSVAGFSHQWAAACTLPTSTAKSGLLWLHARHRDG